MTPFEFHTQAVVHFDRISAAVQADDGSIDSMTVLGNALSEAYGFFSEAHDAIDEQQTREQIEQVAAELVRQLVSNTMKLKAALCAEAELSNVECVQVTLQ
jgi:pyruvoyl-dependent arginine decarboxylase (PvlArgDC)